MCICHPGWSGEICGCPTELDDTHLPAQLATSHLRAVQNYNNICSGHGQCVGSKCQCEAKWQVAGGSSLREMLLCGH